MKEAACEERHATSGDELAGNACFANAWSPFATEEGDSAAKQEDCGNKKGDALLWGICSDALHGSCVFRYGERAFRAHYRAVLGGGEREEGWEHDLLFVDVSEI